MADFNINRITFHSFLESLTNALEARDQYTAGHSDRVAVLSELIAGDMGLSKSSCEGLHIAGHLHDIGKIGIPDGILLKTGSLKDCEYEVIKEHSRIGWKILKDIPGFESIAEIVVQHHERIDGSGYPCGLSGDKISTGAKIIAVADTYDAMTTFRTYKDPVNPAEAVRMIKNEAGIKYSSEVVESMVNVLGRYISSKEIMDEDLCASHI